MVDARSRDAHVCQDKFNCIPNTICAGPRVAPEELKSSSHFVAQSFSTGGWNREDVWRGRYEDRE